jgi:hypothetical protein
MKNILTIIAFLGLLSLIGCAEGASLANDNPVARECDATHSLIGQTRALSVSSLYGISGNITIVSDCEIEISDFFYNGSGPNVSLYGANNGDFSAGVNMSEILNGRTWEGETLNLFLPEGTTLDDINSFSVWCFEFDVNFSSAFFE